MNKIPCISYFISVLALTLLSCGSTRPIAGTYHSRFAELYMFATTVRLKADSTMQYVFQGDMLYDSATGRYRVRGSSVYLEFDREVRDTNKLYYRFDDMPQRHAYYRGDSIPYKMLMYVGRDKLFPAYTKTGRRVTREKAYSRRRRFWLFGSHYYTRRFYYKKRKQA
jgi:hypothetical protein